MNIMRPDSKKNRANPAICGHYITLEIRGIAFKMLEEFSYVITKSIFSGHQTGLKKVVYPNFKKLNYMKAGIRLAVEISCSTSECLGSQFLVLAPHFSFHPLQPLAQRTVFLPHNWETWVEFPAPCVAPHLWTVHLRSEPTDGSFLSNKLLKN